MVRAPCCEKMGLKRGPWSAEEDQILINYINLHGHGNWRALPKQAGLLRCGKSCRLRWTNYLRPDIKRGNFSKEEEETIMQLHQVLGNRWSAIAARLPRRTDNEIKNVWHTHLKKRLKPNQAMHSTPVTKQPHSTKMHNYDQVPEKEAINYPNQERIESPQQSSSDISTTTTATNTTTRTEALEDFPEIDENFWSEVFSVDNSGGTSDFPVDNVNPQAQFPFSPFHALEHDYGYNSSMHEYAMDCFWYNQFTTAGELSPDF